MQLERLAVANHRGTFMCILTFVTLVIIETIRGSAVSYKRTNQFIGPNGLFPQIINTGKYTTAVDNLSFSVV